MPPGLPERSALHPQALRRQPEARPLLAQARQLLLQHLGPQLPKQPLQLTRGQTTIRSRKKPQQPANRFPRVLLLQVLPRQAPQQCRCRRREPDLRALATQ